MATKKKPANKTKKAAARKPNPFTAAAHMHKQYKPKRRKARNPDSIPGLSLTHPVEALKFLLIAMIGATATRQVPQMALGTNNQSWLGFFANGLTAALGSVGTGMVAGKRAGAAFGIGGALYTFNRVVTDKLTPVGRVLSLAGVGDHQASRTLGRIVPGSVYPPSYDRNGNLRLPQPMIDAIRRNVPAPAPAGGGGMSGTRMSGARISS